ncbi:MAG: hypothetical protein DHS80DRAFT_25655 [Piptocephalis tieghemiana]|nr:MAG: hypothetical protein DHS80DRAFT_25655 [Piptocephalis tieghemiana]
MNRRPPVASHTLSPHLDDERVFAVVDKYMQLNISDPETGKYYKILNPKHLRAMLIKFLCAALGGLPYDGENMRRAHKRLNVPRRVMEKAVLHLRTALEAVGGMNAHKVEEVVAYSEYLTLGPGSVVTKSSSFSNDENSNGPIDGIREDGKRREGNAIFPSPSLQEGGDTFRDSSHHFREERGGESNRLPGLQLPLQDEQETSNYPVIAPEDRLWSDGQNGCAMAARTLTKGDFDRLADALVERNTTHPTTRSYFVGTDIKALRRMQAAFLAHALGGPVYDIERMKRAHARLSTVVTHEIFDAFLENMDVVLHETVGKDGNLILRFTQADIILLLAETTRKDIVPESLPRDSKKSSQVLSIGKRIRHLLSSPLKKYKSSLTLKASSSPPSSSPSSSKSVSHTVPTTPKITPQTTPNSPTCPFSSTSSPISHSSSAITLNDSDTPSGCPFSSSVKHKLLFANAEGGERGEGKGSYPHAGHTRQRSPSVHDHAPSLSAPPSIIPSHPSEKHYNHNHHHFLTPPDGSQRP